MKNLFKRFLMLSLAMVMVRSMSTTALAADATITFVNANDPTTGAKGLGIDFKPGSVYTTTDLFDNFKNLMPGDTRTQKITISNQAKNCDYVKVYLYVKPHGEKNEPAVKGQDGYDSLAEMEDFLSQLSMTITCDKKEIYKGSPDKAGALAKPTELGTVAYRGREIEVVVDLTVPKELGNQYADRVGEMDWVFYAEGYCYESVTAEKHWDDGSNKYSKRPSSVKVQLYKGDNKVGDPVELNSKNKWTYTWEELESSGKGEYTVKEVQVPSGYHVSYKKTTDTKGNVIWKITNSMKLIQTGQLNWPIPVLGSLGVLMICIGILLLKRKEQGNA